PIVRGRAFSNAEAEAQTPFAVVSESAARTFWPMSDPLGKTFTLDMDFRGRLATFTVVGIARDIRTANISRVDPAYVSMTTPDGSERFVARSFAGRDAQEPTAGILLVRAHGNLQTARDAIRRSIGRVDPALASGVAVMSIAETFLRVQRVLPVA